MGREVLDWVKDICDEFPQFDRSYCERVFTRNDVHVHDFDDKGVVAFMVSEGFTGKKELNELFFYLKPKHRTLKNLNDILLYLENFAKEKGCDIIRIGANAGFKDELFIKYLHRKGYKTDIVFKEV